MHSRSERLRAKASCEREFFIDSTLAPASICSVGREANRHMSSPRSCRIWGEPPALSATRTRVVVSSYATPAKTERQPISYRGHDNESGETIFFPEVCHWADSDALTRDVFTHRRKRQIRFPRAGGPRAGPTALRPLSRQQARDSPASSSQGIRLERKELDRIDVQRSTRKNQWTLRKCGCDASPAETSSGVHQKQTLRNVCPET